MVRRRPRRSFRRSLYRAGPKLTLLVLAGALVLAVFAPRTGRPDPETLGQGPHRVERAVDGDTLLLANGARVRLQGVDTPETKHPRKPPEPFGREAWAYTARLVEGTEVRLEFDTHRLDRYGRFLAYVYVGDVFLNERLIQLGLGRACLQFAYRSDMKRRFAAAQREARQKRLGIWSLSGPGASQQELEQVEKGQ